MWGNPRRCTEDASVRATAALNGRTAEAGVWHKQRQQEGSSRTCLNIGSSMV